MAILPTKAIMRLFDEVSTKGLYVDENETIENIIKLCEKKGQFIFHVDSFWSFVQTKFGDKKCIRMIFAIKEEDGGKVQNIDRLVDLIKIVEKTLVYIDSAKIIKKNGFMYLDTIKIIKQ